MTKQPAVIFDRDGTLASVDWCKPDDRDGESWRVYNAALPFDAVVPHVAALLRSIRPGVTRIMTSGRAEGDWPGDRRRRFLMQGWLDKHDLPIDLLLMRSGGDMRRDSIVKREMYLDLIEPFYDVRVIVDDRPQVVEMWRSLGLHVIAVTDPVIDPNIMRGTP